MANIYDYMILQNPVSDIHAFVDRNQHALACYVIVNNLSLYLNHCTLKDSICNYMSLQNHGKGVLLL